MKTESNASELTNMPRSPLRGPSAFGPAYRFMLEHDAHAPGSVDRELARQMIRLCPETADYLYASFTSLHVFYEQGSRPKLESTLSTIISPGAAAEEVLTSIVRFTQSLEGHSEQDLHQMLLGGTEEEIIERGSEWCTDVARVACVLCQIAGFPCRIVNLFDTDRAYSGHVIIEAYRDGHWGALDSSTAIVYRKSNGEPLSVWQLMNDPDLIIAHRIDSAACYTSIGQFRAAGISNYYCWDRARYNYSITGLNEYYLSILEMSNQGWPGGLRWLHGEDDLKSETVSSCQMTCKSMGV